VLGQYQQHLLVLLDGGVEPVKNLSADRQIMRRKPTAHAIVLQVGVDAAEWRPNGSPDHVRVRDFVIKGLGRAVPYGAYDIADNTGWVSVGIDHDTAAFAVNAIRSWWKTHGLGALSGGLGGRRPTANGLQVSPPSVDRHEFLPDKRLGL
jgi:hypothetical protein